MANIKRFEDIKAWEKGRKLAKDVYTVTGKGEFTRDYGLKDQIRRAPWNKIPEIKRGQATFLVSFIGCRRGSCLAPTLRDWVL